MLNWEKKIKEETKRRQEEMHKHNEAYLTPPPNITEDEKHVYMEVLIGFKESINYYLKLTDKELIWQYCQIKIIRDRAWEAYNKNPDRYVRIVTGICSDGITPKVMIKENEHYKTLIECNKQMEKILKDLKLTPENRSKKL